MKHINDVMEKAYTSPAAALAALRSTGAGSRHEHCYRVCTSTVLGSVVRYETDFARYVEEAKARKAAATLRRKSSK